MKFFMDFDIDVSGEDIFNDDYAICIANNDGIIKGFKFDPKMVRDLNARFGQGLYKKYKKSQKGRALFKIRLYCIVVYKLLESVNSQKSCGLNICRDFYGREEDIRNNLNFFLGTKLSLNYSIVFTRLGKGSDAHQYAYLMRKDRKNQMSNYVDISIHDFEEFL